MNALLLLVAIAPGQPAALEKAWYSPHELLPALATRDGIRWAMPEALAGRAWVGGDVTYKAALDDACKEWKLNWTEANGVVVVYFEHPRFKEWTAALAKGDTEAAWELGWSRDARAIPPLAEALASKQPPLALAAAQALDTLLTEIPLGREERVAPVLPGRVCLARAFPPKVDLLPLLDAPYPRVRAAALRVLLGQDKPAEAVLAKTLTDRSPVVQHVRQQFLFKPVAEKEPRKIKPLPVPPKDEADRKAAIAKMLEELPRLEKQSAWEEMVWRADTLARWSRLGHSEATEALIELTGTKLQQFWYPGIVQKNLATSGGDRVRAAVKELVPKALRSYMVRGLEESYWGEELVALTGPHLGEQTVCLVTARKAGREALDLIVPLAEKGDRDAIDALAVIGGPKAVATLYKLLMKDEVQSATLAFRSAKALGHIGTADALDHLHATDADKSLHRRHAVVMALGRIGGIKAEVRLKQLAEDQNEARLVRAAAADGLEQIGTKGARAAAEAFRKADAGIPALVYQPRNKRFGPDFPVNTWVDLKITVQAQGWGEIGWNYDPANRLFFRYGGCTGPYNNELTAFDLGTEQFVQRRPIELMAGWSDTRPGNGCSVGRTWDPWTKATWIRHGIGGTPNQLGMAEYQSRSPSAKFCSYDLATDRFRAAPFHEAPYGEATTRLACDWKHGLLFPIKFTHPNHKTKDFWALDVRAENPHAEAAWKKLTNPDGDYPRHAGSAYTTAAVDQDAGRLVLFIPPFESRPAQTWVYDPTKNVWKDMEPAVQPPGVPGAGLVYDPFAKVLLLHSGKKVTQFGGANDAVTWSYDVRMNTWTDLKAANGPGNPWVGAMDFDPEHNVVVLFSFKDKRVWAYRHKDVLTGTKATVTAEKR
jgi:HEAT repeat protein